MPKKETLISLNEYAVSVGLSPSAVYRSVTSGHYVEGQDYIRIAKRTIRFFPAPTKASEKPETHETDSEFLRRLARLLFERFGGELEA